MMQAQASHLPLKVNMAGVIPAIFASSILLFPASVAQWFGSGDSSDWLQDLAVAIGPGQPLNILLFTGFIVFFCFFYTALMFNPQEVADNLKRSGAFRTGDQTRTADSELYRRRADAADGVWLGLHRAGLLAAAVSGGHVQRALLFGRHLHVDCGGGRDGLHGAGTEPSDVASIRRCNEKSQPRGPQPRGSGEIGIRSFR